MRGRTGMRSGWMMTSSFQEIRSLVGSEGPESGSRPVADHNRIDADPVGQFPSHAVGHTEMGRGLFAEFPFVLPHQSHGQPAGRQLQGQHGMRVVVPVHDKICPGPATRRDGDGQGGNSRRHLQQQRTHILQDTSHRPG